MNTKTKGWLLGGIAMMSLSATGCRRSMPRDLSEQELVAEEHAIEALLDDWHRAAASADVASYTDYLAPHAVLLGVSADERWTREAFIQFVRSRSALGQRWTIRASRRAVTVAPQGNAAWFDEDLETQHWGAARGSGVLVREAGRPWKIAQYNISIAIPFDRLADVRAVSSRPASSTHTPTTSSSSTQVEGSPRAPTRDGDGSGGVMSLTTSHREGATAIARTIGSNFARIRQCYADGLRQNPSLSGRVEARLTIGPSGTVVGQPEVTGMPSAPEVSGCMARVLRSLVFEPLGKERTVLLPFNFSPQ